MKTMMSFRKSYAPILGLFSLYFIFMPLMPSLCYIHVDKRKATIGSEVVKNEGNHGGTIKRGKKEV